MLHAPKSIVASDNPNDESMKAANAALREFKVSMRKPVDHPRRAEILEMLADARMRIDRINQSNS